MRREEPTRHGRVADALIATYVRELLADDDETPSPAVEALAAQRTPTVVEAAPPEALAAAEAAL